MRFVTDLQLRLIEQTHRTPKFSVFDFGESQLLGVVVFIIFATLGGVISWWLSLPLPAGIVGMLMLFIALLVGGHLPNWLLRASQKLSPYLTLFIVPASTGIITQSSILNDYGWQLIGILLVSLVPGALVSALVMGWGRRDS